MRDVFGMEEQPDYYDEHRIKDVFDFADTVNQIVSWNMLKH